MSVDKTSLEDDQIKALAIKNDRERFLEVAEYHQDILKYLKTAEVKLSFYYLLSFDFNVRLHTNKNIESEAPSSSCRLHAETA